MVSAALLNEIENEGQDTPMPGSAALASADLLELLDMGNIVDYLPEAAGQKVLDGYGDACGSMTDWLRKYEKAVHLAKMQPKESKKTFPFEGASTAMAPFVMEAMIDFNARTAPELAYSDRIVKVDIYGSLQGEDLIPPPPNLSPELAQQAAQARDIAVQDAQESLDQSKEDRADRVQEYSNYQLREKVPYWPQEMDKLLLSLPCVGTMYRKTYYDASVGVKSDLCYPHAIKFDMSYPTFEAAPDVYEELPKMSRNEVVEKIRGDEGWQIDEDELGEDEDFEFICGYTWFDVDDDGLKEPYYVVVFERTSQAVYARPLYDEDTLIYGDNGEVLKAGKISTFTQYQFIPDPEGSAMGMGWGILLGPMFEQININMRQQIDAGTLQVLASNSGLIASDATTGRGNSVQRGPVEMAMGKLTPISVRGGATLSQSVVQFPASGPSPAMFQLMEYMVESARRLTDASSQVDANPNEAAILYLARLQQTLKRPNVITTRVYNAAKSEFKKIFDLNYKHYSDEDYNRVLDLGRDYSMQEDFNPDDCDIALVADPSQGSDIERAARAEAVLGEAKTQPPQIINLRQAYQNWFEVLGVKDIPSLLPPPSNEPDPMQQLMAMREQVESDLRQRDQRLREQEQDLKRLQLQMDQQQQAMKAAKEMAQMGLDKDNIESQIAERYAKTLQTLVDIGMTDPMQGVQSIERMFIDSPSATLPTTQEIPGARDAYTPTSNPGANPALGA